MIVLAINGQKVNINLVRIGNCSAQLAVFAAATVVQRNGLVLLVCFFLTTEAEPNAGYGLPTRKRNFLTAFFAIFQTLAARDLSARPFDLVFDRGFDLFIDGVVAGPTYCHILVLLCR